MEVKNNQELKGIQRRKQARRLDAIGWGLFFIWIGIAFLADLGWGIGFIGVGVLILGSQAARELLTGSDDCGTTKAFC